MTGAHVQTRIWLSIGIFILGFLVTTIISHVDRLRAEGSLTLLADAVLPASEQGRDADAAFRRVIEGYGDAFLIQDRSGMDRAAAAGRQVLESLKSIGASAAIATERSARARRLAQDVGAFLDDANGVYGSSAPTREEMTPEYQAHVQQLAAQTNRLKSELQILAADLSRDLQAHMSALRNRSARMRRITPAMFAGTLLLAVVLVQVTIRRAVLLPLARTQNALARERDLLDILMNHSPDSIFFKGADCKYMRVNKASAATLGVRDPAEAIGHSEIDYFDPAVAERIAASESRIFETGEPMIGKLEHITRKGRSQWFNTSKVPVRDGASAIKMIVGIARDVTAWKDATDALMKSEESFRQLFDMIPYPVLVYHQETLGFLMVNDAATKQYGYPLDDFWGMTLADLLPPDEAGSLRAGLEGGVQPHQGSWKHVTRDGCQRDVEVHAREFGFTDQKAILAVVQDVTDRKRLETELQQAQRLEAVGHLAAGIAHEINTPVQFVSDNVHFLSDAYNQRQKVMEIYRELHRQAAGAVSRELLDDLDAALADSDFEYLMEEIPKSMHESLDGLDRIATIVRAMKAFAHAAGTAVHREKRE